MHTLRGKPRGLTAGAAAHARREQTAQCSASSWEGGRHYSRRKIVSAYDTSVNNGTCIKGLLNTNPILVLLIIDTVHQYSEQTVRSVLVVASLAGLEDPCS